MVKGKKGSGKKKKGGSKPDSKARAPEEIQRVRNRVRNLIVDSSEEMANRVVQSVNEGGQVAALKYLWEVSGLFPDGAEAESPEEESLAKMLMERLGLPMEIPEEKKDVEGDVESETSG